MESSSDPKTDTQLAYHNSEFIDRMREDRLEFSLSISSPSIDLSERRFTIR